MKPKYPHFNLRAETPASVHQCDAIDFRVLSHISAIVVQWKFSKLAKFSPRFLYKNLTRPEQTPSESMTLQQASC